MSDLGQPLRVEYLPLLAFSVARQRFIITRGDPIKPPNKNWPRAFGKRNPQLKARRVRAIDWKRHENNISVKVTHWFEVIEELYRIRLFCERVFCERMYTIWTRRASC